MDSQSFPLQIPGFTDLAAKGAYSSSQVYTPADVQEVRKVAESADACHGLRYPPTHMATLFAETPELK